MKIIIVDTTLHGTLIGGAQTFLPLLLKGLKEKGHEVHLVIQGTPNKKIKKQIKESGTTIHTGLWDKKTLVEDAAPALAKWINKLKPDIYLISVSPDMGWVVLPYLDPGIASITIGHTDNETFYAPARHYQPFLTNAIAVSDQVSEEYVTSCLMAPQNVKWIPYGVKVNPVAPVENDKSILRIVYAGRLEEAQKRISDLVTIAKKLSQKKLSFQLSIIGDGPEMQGMKEQLKEEIANRKVQLLGWLDNEKVVNMLQQSDVFVLTSAYEGFCIALVEAMANGCCPVVTNIRSGNNQLIQDSVSGFINEIGDVNAFENKLIFLQQNRSVLEAMRKQAWEMGKKYSISKMVENYENCFEEAVQTVKNAPRIMNPEFPLMESCRSSYPRWMRRIKKLITA